MDPVDTLLAPIPDADHREVGGVQVDVVRAGLARLKRVVYPQGFRWSTHMKPVTGTDLCMHAHAGFLARGEVHIRFPDGCTLHFKAPQMLIIEPGHEGWVGGDDCAVVIEFDFEGETVERLGMARHHSHPEAGFPK